MTHERFNRIMQEQIDRCVSVMGKKADEYATDDRLHNVKIAAILQGETPVKALGGHLSKHTVSIFDMINASNNGKIFPVEQWNEKITDGINYLLILRALVEEEEVFE